MTDWTPYTAARPGLVRKPAGPDLRRVRGDRARGGQRCRVRSTRRGSARGAVGRRRERRRNRRRHARRDQGQGVREGGRQRLDRHGALATDFAGTINGASAEQPAFSATGISLVAHMANPHVPAVHMNTRFLTTTKAWFGGGADLNPPIPYDEDTAEFHAELRAACDAHNPIYYERFKQVGRRLFLHPAPQGPSRRGRHLLRPSRMRR